MRMNKVPKGWLKSIETYKKKYEDVYGDKPNHKILLPGRIHPIILFSKLIPQLIYESTLSSEIYAKEYVEWSTSIIEESSDIDVCNNNDDKTCLNNKTSATIVTKPKDHLFDSKNSITEFTDFLRNDVQKYYTSNIKIQINAAKFQRIIDEQYGYFLPIVKKYPKFEPYFKSMMKKRALGHFKITRKKPGPLNKTTSIILLFMLYRNGVRRDIVALSGLFLLVGLQPFVLVLLIVIGRLLMDGRKNRIMKGFNKKKAYNTSVDNVENIKEVIKKPVGMPLDELDDNDDNEKKEYDAIVLGDTIDALFTAALLSKCGKRVCVLSSNKDAASGLTMQKDNDDNTSSSSSSSCLYTETPSECKDKLKEGYENIPFDTSHGQIYNFETIQSYLAPVLTSTTDIQGGVRFVPIGNESNGYSFAMMDIPTLNETGTKFEMNKECYILRPGYKAFLDDIMYYFGSNADSSPYQGIIFETLVNFLTVCNTLQSKSSKFFVNKMLSTNDNDNKKEDDPYELAAKRPASTFLQHGFPTTPPMGETTIPSSKPPTTPIQRHINKNLISYLTGIASRYEDMDSSSSRDSISMAIFISHVNSIIKSDAFFYPVGGMRCLGHALYNVITSHGGQVYTNVNLQQFVCSNNNTAKDGTTDAVNINAITTTTKTTSKKKHTFYTNGPMVSTLGFIQTYLKLLPEYIRNKHGIPEGVSHLTQRRPLLKLLIALDGSADDLNLSSLDYFRLPNSANSTTSSSSDATINAEDAANTVSSSVKTKYKPNTSYIQITFPSTKDPSWKDIYGDVSNNNISTCVVTIEADDDFVKFMDNSRSQRSTCPLPQTYKYMDINDNNICKNFVDKVMKDVLSIYPHLKDKILRMELHGPTNTGITQSPLRFNANTIRPLPSPNKYPNLYMSGTDISLDTLSASFISSYMCANSIMGYDYFDYTLLNKDVTYDITKFSSSSCYYDDEDELLPISIEDDDGDNDDSGQENEEKENLE